MRLAIVIPTLDEADRIEQTVARARTEADDVVVVDGGSRDDTAQRAAAAGARVLTGPTGRGGQLAHGVRATRAEALLFLHADTRLPTGAADAVRRALAAGHVGGGFRCAFEDPGTLDRLAARLVNLRSRLTGCPLGDQAQFASRAAYDAIGGFADWPILEDLDFARRLKRHGSTILLEPPAVTAPRRARAQGRLRSIAINWLIWSLYFAGLAPHRLARLYRHVR